MTIEAKIIADSVNPDGKRITTVQCRLPRFIWPQMLTHRNFSRNAQSSRACPVNKMIEEVEKDPAMPIHWGANQKGMQADEECNNTVNCIDPHTPGYGFKDMNSDEAWIAALDFALEYARAFSEAGYHKQIVNRLLEPFMHISVIITATEWDNFFKLRMHEDSQPEIQQLAKEIYNAMLNSYPTELNWGEWHVPYALDVPVPANDSDSLLKSSTAACARCSYNNHDGSNRTIEKDRQLHDMLIASSHLSPTEHPAKAMRGQYANFNGFCSYRWELEHENL